MASKLERQISFPPPPLCVVCKQRSESVGIKPNGRCYHDECWRTFKSAVMRRGHRLIHRWEPRR